MSAYVKFYDTSYDDPREVWVKTSSVSSVCQTVVPSNDTIICLDGGESYLVSESVSVVVSKLDLDR